MKIVITGGSGFIGTNLIEYLSSFKYEIINLDIKKPVNDYHFHFWKKVDIRNIHLLSKTILEFAPQIIIHLAARTDLDGKTIDEYDTNILGTENIINVAKECDSLKKVFFTSSMYVCKPGFIPKDYNTYNPHTIYGESKVEGEQLVKRMGSVNFSWTIIRPTSIWGPWFDIPYVDFFHIIYEKKYFDFGKTCSKTYGFVGNTVYQVKKLMDSSLTDKKTYYLGDSPAINISDWAREISREMGKGKIFRIPFYLIFMASKIGDLLKQIGVKFPINSFRLNNMTTDNILPLDNLNSIVGESPYDRTEGVRQTLEWLVKFRGYIIK